MNGKGDRQRPLSVPMEVFGQHWEAIFRPPPPVQELCPYCLEPTGEWHFCDDHQGIGDGIIEEQEDV